MSNLSSVDLAGITYLSYVDPVFNRMGDRPKNWARFSLRDTSGTPAFDHHIDAKIAYSEKRFFPRFQIVQPIIREVDGVDVVVDWNYVQTSGNFSMLSTKVERSALMMADRVVCNSETAPFGPLFWDGVNILT
jgi:hypothetical protein